MGKGGVNAVVHPRQGLERFGAGHARGRQKTALREFFVQIERDRHDLGDGLLTIDQNRNLASRIDGLVGGFVLLAFVQLDHFGFERSAAEFEQTMRHKRTCARGEIKLE